MRGSLLDTLPAAISGVFGAVFASTVVGAGLVYPTPPAAADRLPLTW